jgi:FHS family L-fucose permease-like MFS transporter
LGAAFVLVAVVFKISSIPNKIDTEEAEKEPKSPDILTRADGSAYVGSKAPAVRAGATSYPQLVLGMVAIFIYVGVEVATASNLPHFMKEHVKGADGLAFPTEKIAPFVSLYWASLMMGRWTASVGAFNITASLKSVLRFVMPYLAFGVFLLINKIANHDITPFYLYALIIVALIIGDLLSRGNPARQLLIFSLFGIIALVVGILADGMVSVYAFMSVGLFCSTLWPCIFTLAIAGLGRHTNTGASYLVMMIMGGGFISLLQGYLADANLMGIQWSFVVDVLCFAYLAFYAIRAKGILKAQGIDYDNLEGAGAH